MPVGYDQALTVNLASQSIDLVFGTFIRATPACPLPVYLQVPHSTLGAALSLLLVFRTNSSSSRFTEGRMVSQALPC